MDNTKVIAEAEIDVDRDRDDKQDSEIALGRHRHCKDFSSGNIASGTSCRHRTT